jgi:hypothetical protein
MFLKRTRYFLPGIKLQVCLFFFIIGFLKSQTNICPYAIANNLNSMVYLNTSDLNTCYDSWCDMLFPIFPSHSNSLNEVNDLTNAPNLKNFNVIIFPNPASDFIFVKSNFDCQIKIFGQSGEVMFAGELIKNKKTISLASLSVGIYFVKIKGQGYQKAIRLVKTE